MPPKNSDNRITKWNRPGENGNLKAIIIFDLHNLAYLLVRKTFGSHLFLKNCSLFRRFISNSILWLKFCNKGKCKRMYVCSSKLGKCLFLLFWKSRHLQSQVQVQWRVLEAGHKLIIKNMPRCPDSVAQFVAESSHISKGCGFNS